MGQCHFNESNLSTLSLDRGQVVTTCLVGELDQTQRSQDL